MTERLELEGKSHIDFMVDTAERWYNETRTTDRASVASAAGMLVGHLVAELLTEVPEKAFDLPDMVTNIKQAIEAAAKGALALKGNWSEIRKHAHQAIEMRERMQRQLQDALGLEKNEPQPAAARGH